MKFAMLPDREVPPRTRETLGNMGLVLIASHPSGLPWLLSDQINGWLVIEPDRDTRLAVPKERGASARLAAVRADRFGELADRLDVDTFLVATDRRKTYAQGTISTDRQIFWSMVDGSPIASNSLDVLHRSTQPTIDQTTLVLGLISSLPIQPFATRTPWTDIHALGIGNRLVLDRAGQVREERWWRDPAREFTGDEAAQSVRQALYSAVRKATDSASPVTADLSGGLDSTSVCFVLRDLGQHFITFRTSSLSASNDEGERARRIAHDMDISLHEFPPLAESSSAFDLDPETNSAAVLEGPLGWAASRGYLEKLAPAVVGAGSRIHFTGLGGDELFDLVPGLFRAVWRESKIRALSLIRQVNISQRIDPRPLIAGASNKENYSNYLSRVARTLTDGNSMRPADAYSWFPPIELPPWFTPQAREIAVEAIRELAVRPCSPLGDDPLSQQVTESVAFQGKILRQFGEVFSQFSIDWRAPFTDAGVLNAVLGAPAGVRFSESLDKPLLAAAVGRAASPDFYRKRGRSDFTSDIYAEHKRRRATLAQEFGTSLLVDEGLVDPAVISAIFEPPSSDVGLLDVERIVTAERWLRSAHAGRATMNEGAI